MSSTENLPLPMRVASLQDEVVELREKVAKLETLVTVFYEAFQENPPRSLIMGRMHRAKDALKSE